MSLEHTRVGGEERWRVFVVIVEQRVQLAVHALWPPGSLLERLGFLLDLVWCHEGVPCHGLHSRRLQLQDVEDVRHDVC